MMYLIFKTLAFNLRIFFPSVYDGIPLYKICLHVYSQSGDVAIWSPPLDLLWYMMT